jgi:two-component system, LuxR family, response regulator FixJ
LTQAKQPRVYIVDDDAAVRASLRALLGSVGLPAMDFPSGEAFLEAVDEGTRGCLLLDVRMPGMSGLQLQEALQERGVRMPIIVITGHGDVPMAVRAMKAGAADFIEKPFNHQQLLERIQGCLEADVQTDSEEQRRRDAAALLDQLTAREREVLELLVMGKASKVIAAALGISEKTVDVHRSNVMKKTGTRSVAELVRLWLRVHSVDDSVSHRAPPPTPG